MDYDDYPDGVIIAGPDGIVEYVNERIRDMARAIGDEMIGMHLSEAVPFDDLNGNSWYDCSRPYDGLNIRKRVSEQGWWSPKGSEYLITASLVRDRPAGPVTRVVVSVRNARIRNQRDRERSDLVATVAHELRSPLTGIKGFTSTLLTKWDKFTEEQRRLMLETVDSDADRLSRLITELLDAARIDAGRLTLKRGPVKLDEVVRNVLTNMSGGATEPFGINIGDDLDLIWGDSDRMTQVVTNLVENAMRHGFGLREVVVKNTQHPDFRGGVSLEIHDHGPGIPEEMRQRVFSRFWRSGPGAGSGLGMYIVRGIVEQHGGSIDILDAEGGGAQIRVWFPINEPDSMTD
ncbi:PAS domain-containing sensor histidine kinase [Aeromicrobium sp.]|uniref:sensor histidine kinase n=1 Tax=Aeromicrobium sp. TaxID=1871063 RepID=UPI0019A68DF1|nr:PAS domain-containing sensor histidine kinase [Aeromicrobium sp.]MBC7633215.1 PAS domain-containing sensor histidine kinase [Aeromicrobium sp.]